MPVDNSEACAYREESEESWNAEAARTASVSLQPNEQKPTVIVVTGPCPRCAHDVYFTEPLITYWGMNLPQDDLIAQALAETIGEPTARILEIVCSCGEPHAGAPENTRGCGASWVLTVEWGD